MTMFPADGYTKLYYQRDGYVAAWGDTERLDVLRDESVKPDDKILWPVHGFLQDHGLIEIWNGEGHAPEDWQGWEWLSATVKHTVYVQPAIKRLRDVPPMRDRSTMIVTQDDADYVRLLCNSVSKPQGVQRWSPE